MSSDRAERSTTTDELNDDDIRRIAQEETAVETSDGETVRLADLVALGLDKQDAIAALGLVAMGAGIGTAVTIASTDTAEAQATTGEGTITIDELLANLVDATAVEAGELSGDLVGRAEAIDHLAGNIHVIDEEPSGPTDGDLLFLEGGGS